MSDFQVTCINKPNRMSPHEHITHIGNSIVADKWRMTREEAIRRINSKQDVFYTVDRYSGRRVYIGVVSVSATKSAYLRTHADGKWNDNLLALDDCNGMCRLVG